MSQQFTGAYCKQNSICAHRLAWSRETSVAYSLLIPQIDPRSLRPFLKVDMIIPLSCTSPLTSDILLISK